MRRPVYTHGFARALPIGAAVVVLVPFLATLAWPSYATVAIQRNILGVVFVAAASAGGILAVSRLPRHPEPREGARNGAIAALATIGVAYLATLALSLLDRPLATDFTPFKAECVRWLLPCAILAGGLGAIVGRFRSLGAARPAP